MSVESATAFLDRLYSDPEFQAKFSPSLEPAAAKELAKAEGFDFNGEEMKQALKEHEQSPELSDEQLEAIAGGDATDEGSGSLSIPVYTGCMTAALVV